MPSLIGTLGKSGANGRGIKSVAVTEYYKLSASNSGVSLPDVTCGTDGDDDSDSEISTDESKITADG